MERSATVEKIIDLIGRGRCSIATAAGVSHSLVRAAVFRRVAEVAAWSMKWASMGRWPDAGFDGKPFATGSARAKMCGQPLADGFRACYVGFKADLKARHECHGFSRWYKSSLICEQCLARRDIKSPDSMNYRNFTSSAAWPLTMLDHDQWMTLGEHSDWNLVEGFRLESVGFDLMHNVFLGVGKDLVGSGLKLLIQQGAFDHVEGVHDDLDKALGVIHQEMVQDCKNHGLFLPSKPVLSVAGLCGDDDYAMLNSRFKACHCKVMVWWLAFKSQQAADANQDDRLLQVLATCCYGMQRAIEILDNSGLLMSESDANETAECLQLHLVTYAWLAAYYWEEGVLLFRFRPKHHYLFHQAVQIAEWRLNQSIFHTWDQESFLGKIKQICVKCHGATATVRVFERYLLCMAMMLEQHRRVQS
ncbi:unnamed protein product [Cladocopium goreaui]|uniref:Uncharacterized protein n=1 Tax=Cladocopium goreaui TaxID=2562237 RepID=A0A9P1G5C9_9DINO|nr:unnamed protein product [Cladocopium goreaui]